MTEVETSLDIAAASARAMIEQSNRLGLTWIVRLGTVVTSSPLTVTYDGDTEPILMTSIIGQLGAGNRVYAIAVPPSANFVIGYVTGAGAGFGVVFGESFTGNPLLSTLSSAEDVIAFPSTGIQFQTGRAYLFKARVRVDSAIAQVFGFRIRMDDLTGQLIAVEPGDTRVGTSNFRWLYTEVPVMCENTSFRDVILTGAGGTGANPVNWRGGTGSECYLLIQDIGPRERFIGTFAVLS